MLDEFTVQVSFETPYAPFLTYAAAGTLSWSRPRRSRETATSSHPKPVGTGPFMIKEYVAKDHATMVRNPAYARKAPWSDRTGPAYLDAVVWKFVPEAGTRVTTLESGETPGHLFRARPGAARAWRRTRAMRVEKLPVAGRAAHLAAQRHASRRWTTCGCAARSTTRSTRTRSWPPSTRAPRLKAVAPLTAVMLDDPALRQAYPFDPPKAKALLGEAGWQPGGDGIRAKGGQRLEIVLNAIEYGGGADPTAQLIQASLREVGIDVKIKAQARPPWYEDNYRCATHGPGDVPALHRPRRPLRALPLVAGRRSNFNWSCVKNAKLDQLLEQGRRESDPAKRRAIYVPDREARSWRRRSRVPLVDELAVWAFRANVQGVKYNFNAYPVLSDVTLRK